MPLPRMAEAMPSRRPVVALVLALLLLAASPVGAGLGVGEAGRAPAGDPGEAPAGPEARPHSASTGARLSLAPTYADAAVMGMAGTLDIAVQAHESGADNVVLRVKLPAGVRTLGETTVAFDRIEANASATASFPVHTLETGTHEIQIDTFADLRKPVTRLAWLHVEPLAPAWLELDFLAAEPVFADGVPLEAPGFGGDATDEPLYEPEISGKPWPATPGDDPGEAALAAQPELGDGPASLAQGFEARVCWNFNNDLPSDPWWSRLRWADVVVRASVSGRDPVLAEGQTDSKGCARIVDIPRTVNGQPTRAYVVMRTCNLKICVVGPTAPYGYGWKTDIRPVPGNGIIDFGDWGTGTRQYAGRAFAYANNGWSWFVNVGQHPASLIAPVEVRIPSQQYGEDWTFAIPWKNEIYVAVNGEHEYSDDTAIHEYTHHVQWHAVKDAWSSPGGKHSLCEDSQDPALAWTEGFAGFASVRANFDLGAKGVPGATSDRLLDADKNLDIEKAGCVYSKYGVAGENEWSVAQSLWDVVDLDADGIDVRAWNLPDVLYLVRACKAMSFHAYYAGTTWENVCSWRGAGRPLCVIQSAARPHDYLFRNGVPEYTALSPTKGAFARGTITLATTITPPEGNGLCPYSTEIYLTDQDKCSAWGADVEKVHLGNFSGLTPSVTWNTKLRDDGTRWRACGYIRDGFDGGLTRSERFWIDNTPPKITFEGSANAQGWYDSPPWIPFDCTDSFSGPTARDDWFMRIDSGTWTSLDPWDTSFQGDLEGVHMYSVFCEDLAGNGVIKTETVRLDTKAPAVQVTYTPNEFDRERVEIRLTCTDPAPSSGCTPMWSFTNIQYEAYTGPIVITEGERRFNAHAVDTAGNQGPTTIDYRVGIERVAPSVWVNVTRMDDTQPLGEWHVSPPRIDMACSDAGAGERYIFYSLDGGPEQRYGAPFYLEGDGVRNVTATCTDWARNTENATAIVRVDAVAPVASYKVTGLGTAPWYREDVTLDVECENVGAAIYRRGYRLDTGAWIWHRDTSAFVIAAVPGAHLLEVRCSLISWWSGNATGALNFDLQAPTVTLPGDTGWTSTARIIHVSCADDVSGCGTILSRIDGGPWRARGAAIRIEGGGEHLLEVYAIDLAGNGGAIASARYGVDDTPPEVTISVGDAAGYVIASWTASDTASGLSGLAYVEVENASAPGGWETLCTTGVGGTSASDQCFVSFAVACYRIRVADVAGNEGMATACYAGGT